MERVRHLHVEIPEELFVRFKALTVKRQESASEVVRRLIKVWCDKVEEEIHG